MKVYITRALFLVSIPCPNTPILIVITIIIIVIAYIYKAPFLSRAHSALQLYTTSTIHNAQVLQSHRVKHNLLTKRAHTHAHTLTLGMVRYRDGKFVLLEQKVKYTYSS